MTNEERLEDIKLEYVQRPSLRKQSVQWLIQQAEHAQHLERKYENTGSMFGRQAQRTLIDENKRLREALDFYADVKSYEPKYDWYEKLDYELSDAHEDEGMKARKALEDNQ